ncbi:MAG: response regulator [Dehalococcoidales bacterium]|nr:MAG: response regulator [Dehalococcoidales bacterium]
MTEKAVRSRKKSASGKVSKKKPVTRKKKEKILIIDDEPAFVESCRRTMEAKAYKVFTTSDKEHAMEMMESEPDVIILGTLAPAGQTFAMYKWLEQHPRYKDIPILVIDARQGEQNIRGLRTFENVQVDGDEYLAKPIEPVSLMPRIRSLLDAKTKTIKILVVDDHTMIRTGISAVIALQKDMEVISEAVNGQDAVDKVMRFTPHVALVDIFMPVMSGIEATKLISEKYPETKVLILTQYDEEENMIVAKQSGAFGFIPKKAASSDLIRGIRYVSQGKYFPSEFAELVVN